MRTTDRKSLGSEHDEEALRHSEEQGYEVRDARFGSVLIIGYGAIVLIIIGGFVGSVIVYKQMNWILRRPPASPQFQVQQEILPPVPRLEVHPPADLNEFREAEEKHLNSYGWVDKNKGIVRIPVQRAMQLLSQGMRAVPTGDGTGTDVPGIAGQANQPDGTGRAGMAPAPSSASQNKTGSR